ncbi:MAG TPA: DUF5752 family protein [Bryobacteraceae bacterium]|nr:DUF5752 family protein [Bryobacteraceae bacterium]
MNTATQPFQFATAAYLTCVENQKAETVLELFQALEQASDAAIFNHTFQSLSRYHFLTEGFSNDFAQWVLASLNQPVLAERLASIDIRDYVSIAELRADVRRILSEYASEHPQQARQEAFEPFYFSSVIEVTVPLPWDARTLAGLRAGLERLSHASFYHHFIASRLRLQLGTNDFSHWFATALGLDQLAARTNRIDIYTNTLDTARQELIALLDREMAA